MEWFKNLKIGMRLAVSFAFANAILIIMIVFGITQLNSLNADVENLAHDKFPKTIWANNIIDAVNEAARGLRNYMITDDPDMRKSELERFKVAAAKVNSNSDSLARTIKSDEG